MQEWGQWCGGKSVHWIIIVHVEHAIQVCSVRNAHLFSIVSNILEIMEEGGLLCVRFLFYISLDIRLFYYYHAL